MASSVNNVLFRLKIGRFFAWNQPLSTRKPFDRVGRVVETMGASRSALQMALDTVVTLDRKLASSRPGLFPVLFSRSRGESNGKECLQLS